MIFCNDRLLLTLTLETPINKQVFPMFKIHKLTSFLWLQV